MSETQTIEIRLPEGKELSVDELGILRNACEALIGLSCRNNNEPPAQVRAMSDEGWEVRSGLTWFARAERDKAYEEAIGESRGEALCRLSQMLGLHTVDGCP